jgi:hypothetical protein
MEYKILSLKEAKDDKHKYQVILLDMTTGKKHLVRFGAYGMNDYTIYSKNNDEQKERHKRNYLNRHRKNEDWTISGILTPGFFARWILWNKPTVEESLKYTIKKFKIKLSD